jgi:hypothetical protein
MLLDAVEVEMRSTTHAGNGRVYAEKEMGSFKVICMLKYFRVRWIATLRKRNMCPVGDFVIP